MNKNLISLKKGAGFGELALMSDEPRMASVKTLEKCVLATLTKNDFMKVIRRAQKRKMIQEVHFLKSFTLFQRLSNMKLQKLYYLLKLVELPKHSVLYKQRDEPVDGVYLIQEGEIVYEIQHEYTRPDYAKNSWLNPSVLENGMNKVKEKKQIATFGKNDIVGFEEILRKRILSIL